MSRAARWLNNIDAPIGMPPQSCSELRGSILQTARDGVLPVLDESELSP